MSIANLKQHLPRENGSAKPQSGILYQLGEGLGVSVDELLACKYRSAENGNTQRALAVKKALWNKAYEALTVLYGDVPPLEILNRYYSEYVELESSAREADIIFPKGSRLAGIQILLVLNRETSYCGFEKAPRSVHKDARIGVLSMMKILQREYLCSSLTSVGKRC